MKAFAWPVIIQAGGLARNRGPKLELTEDGKKWSAFGIIDEFPRIDIIKGQKGKGKRYFSAPENRRKRILDALREVPVDSWVAVDEFSRYIRANDFDFFVTSGRCHNRLA